MFKFRCWISLAFCLSIFALFDFGDGYLLTKLLSRK
jgi:hypothetical protein